MFQNALIALLKFMYWPAILFPHHYFYMSNLFFGMVPFFPEAHPEPCLSMHGQHVHAALRTVSPCSRRGKALAPECRSALCSELCLWSQHSFPSEALHRGCCLLVYIRTEVPSCSGPTGARTKAALGGPLVRCCYVKVPQLFVTKCFYFVLLLERKSFAV